MGGNFKSQRIYNSSLNTTTRHDQIGQWDKRRSKLLWITSTHQTAMLRNRATQLSSRALRTFRANASRGSKGYSTGAGPEATSPSPKSFSITKFLFKLSLLTGTVYTVGAAAALIYEPLYEPYLDYFPFGEQVVDKVDYTWKHRAQIANDVKSFNFQKFYNQKYSQMATTVNDTAAQLGLDNYIEIPNDGVSPAPVVAKPAIAVATTPASSESPEKKDNYIVLSNSDIKKVILPLITIKSDDATVNAVIQSLNSVITDFNNSKVSDNTSKLVEKIQTELNKISISFDSKDIQAAVNERLVSVQQQFEHEKTALVEKLTITTEATKKALEKKHQETFANERKELEKALRLEYENKLKVQEIELLNKFNDLVNSKVESERDNKLAKLSELATRVDSIENLEIQLSKIADSYTTFKEIKKSISKLHTIIYSNISSSTRGQALVDEINKLKALTAPLDNKLIEATLQSLPSEKELLQNGGVLTQGQILTRWDNIVPELRKASLLPENPGVLGFAASAFFSKFLWSKSGVVLQSEDMTIGNDVESVIARVNNYLQKNQLDNAVEEVSNLKGIARTLANTWIEDTRRKLEIQFLVDVLSAEVNVSA